MNERTQRPNLAAVLNRPLMVNPAFLEAWIVAVLGALKGSGRAVGKGDGAEKELRPRELLTAATFVPGAGRWGVFSGYWTAEQVAVVDVFGPLGFRRFDWDPWGEVPNQTYDDVAAALEAAAGDGEVARIVMRIDSPGGTVDGAFEAAERIYRARGGKPVVAVANEMAYSAAYLLASAANRVVVGQTAGVGSIGILTQHVDLSKLDQNWGITWTPIYAGSRKADGYPHAPLSKEAYAAVKGRVDQLYEHFVEIAARNRGLSPEAIRAQESDIFLGPRGVEAGLADSAQDFGELLAAISGDGFLMTSQSSMKGEEQMSKEKEKQVEAPGADVVAGASAPAHGGGETAGAPADRTAPEPQGQARSQSEAVEMAHLCQLAGAPERLAGYLIEGKSVAEVRADLTRYRAQNQEQQEISSHVDPFQAGAPAGDLDKHPLVQAARHYGTPGRRA